MREMKDSGIEWIGEIPNDWDVSKIKFVADFEPTCNFENVSPEDRIAYAPMECIKQGFYEARDALYEELSHSLTPFQNGDIVMAKVTPCFENGNIAIMNELPSGIGLGSSELFVFRAKYIVAKYLFYWLQNSDFIQRACSTMTGVGGLKRVSPFFCKNCEIHIPPYNEQCRIADYLDRKCSQIDAIIARQQEMIEKLKAYKLSIITETVTKGLNPDVTMKDSGIEWIGEIPEHWEIVRLKLLGTARNGLTYSPSDICDANEGTLVLRSSNIQNGQLTFDDNVYVSCEIKDDLMVRPGDILICSRNGSRKLIGKNAIIDDTIASFGAFMMIFRTSQNPKYIKYILDSSIFTYYLGTFLTSTINQLTGANFNSMEIPFTWKADEQETIVNYLETKCAKIERLISIKQFKIDKLTAYKKSLIYEVVTGKKEV